MSARRSFLSRFGLAAAALTFGSAHTSAERHDAPAGPGGAQAPAERPSPWQPARDAKDDWFDQMEGHHRDDASGADNPRHPQ